MNENYEFDDLDLDSLENQLNTVDGVTLADMDLPPIKYAIKDLLPQGLAMLSGSMKIGKSWMTLDWCVRIAKGENIWNFPTTKGTTLYLSLEDSNTRLQDRLLSVTDDVPPQRSLRHQLQDNRQRLGGTDSQLCWGTSQHGIGRD